MIASNGPSPATGSSWSPRRKSIRSRTPIWAALRRATARASSEISMATKRAAGLVVRRRDGQTTRAGADIDGAGRRQVAGVLQVFDDDEFRFGTGDQHGRRDREGQRIKLLAADEIGHGRSLGRGGEPAREMRSATTG